MPDTPSYQTRTEPLVLYVDGGCSGNGQLDMSKRKMVSVVTDAHGTVLRAVYDSGGSNNIAELIAVEQALQYAASQRAASVTIYTDSRNNLSWANGSKPGKGINDRARVLRIQERIAGLRLTVHPTLVWVPREQNLAGHVIEADYGL